MKSIFNPAISFKIKAPQSNGGFTFIETLVAIAVLLLAVAAPLSIGSQGLTASRISKNQITALYMAQEGIEYVRYVRDTNSLEGQEWLQELAPCTSTDGCRIDVPLGTIAACGGPCPPLRYQVSSGRYGYTTGWSGTPYSRTITIVEEVPSQEAIVRVTVSWPDSRLTRTVTLGERIHNWQ